ncbi:MAG TPA: hypothetical protein VNZ64_05325 [Candidatus Acidoferrum sp.]|nr:hypothetical protein [Candidatus Acidoferrum sp.]
MTAADSEALKVWFFWYDVSVAGVILGVALEVPEIIRRWSRLLASRFNKDAAVEPWYNVAHESKSPQWLHAVEGFGWFILLSGLALEQCAHVQITAIKDREIANLTANLSIVTTNLDATTKWAAEMDRARVELEKQVMPRVFPPVRQNEAARTLSKFSGVSATVVCVDDPEARFLEQQISPVLFLAAGWNECPPNELTNFLRRIPEGVTVESPWAFPGTVDPKLEDARAKANVAAGALVEQLSQSNIRATNFNLLELAKENFEVSDFPPMQYPLGTVVVWIGRKPSLTNQPPSGFPFTKEPRRYFIQGR